jgi:hypothetical protein
MIERVFYRLPELAERWACTVHDLLHLGIQDRAQICVNIYGMASGSKRTRMETESPEVEAADEPLTDEERGEAEAHDAAFERWKARTTKDMPHGVFELGHDELRFLDLPDAFPYALGEALKFDGGWWACEFDPPVSINPDHLCILHAEVQRLDREVFGAGAQASDPEAASAPLHPRAEATYLTIIGALLELVRNPRPGRDSDAAVIRELIENYSDKPGISKTTLEGKFADARRRLHST